MGELMNSIKITGVAKSITDIFGIEAPEKALPAIDIIVNQAKSVFGGKNADRVFIYNPDAVALWLFQKYTALFEKAVLSSRIQLPLLAVMPSVTPVCFASMYTGAMPSEHGIEAYEKPVLTTETVFDAFIKAGKKPAIISTANDSISVIFQNRQMDYFIYDTHEECTRKAVELIERDEHDLIVLYNGNYDTTMHRTGPEAESAINELKSNIDTFAMLHNKIEAHWKNHRTLLGFCPDHGCHLIDGDLGSHGLDMAQDMNVIHLFDMI